MGWAIVFWLFALGDVSADNGFAKLKIALFNHTKIGRYNRSCGSEHFPKIKDSASFVRCFGGWIIVGDAHQNLCTNTSWEARQIINCEPFFYVSWKDWQAVSLPLSAARNNIVTKRWAVFAIMETLDEITSQAYKSINWPRLNSGIDQGGNSWRISEIVDLELNINQALNLTRSIQQELQVPSDLGCNAEPRSPAGYKLLASVGSRPFSSFSTLYRGGSCLFSFENHFSRSVGRNLGVNKGPPDQKEPTQGEDQRSDSSPEQIGRPFRHVLLGFEIAISALFVCLSIFLILLGFHRSGEAIDRVLDGFKIYWISSLSWFGLAIGGACLSTAVFAYWIEYR